MDVALENKEAAQDETSNDNAKLWFALWISFAISLSVWFVSKMFKGRQNLHNNFTMIQNELERMHALMEQREAAALENKSNENDSLATTNEDEDCPALSDEDKDENKNVRDDVPQEITNKKDN